MLLYQGSAGLLSKCLFICYTQRTEAVGFFFLSLFFSFISHLNRSVYNRPTCMHLTGICRYTFSTCSNSSDMAAWSVAPSFKRQGSSFLSAWHVQG